MMYCEHSADRVPVTFWSDFRATILWWVLVVPMHLLAGLVTMFCRLVMKVSVLSTVEADLICYCLLSRE